MRYDDISSLWWAVMMAGWLGGIPRVTVGGDWVHASCWLQQRPLQPAWKMHEEGRASLARLASSQRKSGKATGLTFRSLKSPIMLPRLFFLPSSDPTVDSAPPDLIQWERSRRGTAPALAFPIPSH